MTTPRLLAIASAGLALTTSLSANDFPDTVIERIACGSCAHQDKKMAIFGEVLATDPDVFLFTGDNIYGDTEDMAVMRKKYAKLDSKPEFAALRAEVPIIPAWDDHDYGENDAGAEYPEKVASQEVFAEFWKLPAESRVHDQPGTYDAYYYGPPEKRVQILALDTRYFRSPLVRLENRVRGSGPYGRNSDPEATLLGAEQWAWLEAQLQEPAQIRFIISSIQFVTDEHHWELWANFPLERQRMLEMIDEQVGGPVIFVSGDRHLAEISRMTSPGGHAIWDVTASSLTNPGGGKDDEPNRFRASDGNYRGTNFGLISIDWLADGNPEVRASILDDDGETVLDVPMLGGSGL